MIEALLHGKLSRDQENMEDLLTSAVFGRLQHLPARVLGAFLAHARTLGGERPLQALAAAQSVEYTFWPLFRELGRDDTEPDVLLTVRDAVGGEWCVLIEAKYRSGKSSRAAGDEPASEDLMPHSERKIRDQLAREWEHLARFDAQGWVVYLTPSFVMPRLDLAEAQAELRAKKRPPGRFCWLSWRALDHLNGSEPLIVDLHRLLDRLDLRGFHGVRPVENPVSRWEFATEPWRMKGSASRCETKWRFDRHGGRVWNWSMMTSGSNWRFAR
jgi:hypothetical protein